MVVGGDDRGEDEARCAQVRIGWRWGCGGQVCPQLGAALPGLAEVELHLSHGHISASRIAAVAQIAEGPLSAPWSWSSRQTQFCFPSTTSIQQWLQTVLNSLP
jgi:hypothetical protein